MSLTEWPLLNVIMTNWNKWMTVFTAKLPKWKFVLINSNRKWKRIVLWFQVWKKHSLSELIMVPLQIIHRWQHAKTQLARLDCSVILETCKLTVISSAVKSAYRLTTKRPRPHLGTFHATTQRDMVILSHVDQIRSSLARIFQYTSTNTLQPLIRNYFAKLETWTQKKLLSQRGLLTARFLSDGLKLRDLYV